MRRQVAFLVSSGPEARAFIYSGLIEAVAQRHNVKVFTPRISSQAFKSLENITVIEVPHVPEHALLVKLRYYTRRAIERRLGYDRNWRPWRHKYRLGSPEIGDRSRLAGRVWKPISSLLVTMETLTGRQFGTQPVWQHAFESNEIDLFVTATYSSLRVIPALQTARNLGVKLLIVPNSWKDVYVNPHLAVIPDAIASWGENAAQILEHANRRLRSRIVRTNSLHLLAMMRGEEVFDKRTLSSILGLDPDRPYVCYTAAAPNAVVREVDILREILDGVETLELEPRPQVLLRTNPMETADRFSELTIRFGDTLVVQRPAWEWDAEADWCCPMIEDGKIWHSIIFHSLMNLSIPSTVTLEYLAVGRPVVNICYDADIELPPNQSNKRYWQAEFYGEVRGHELVTPAFSLDELLDRVRHYLSKSQGELHSRTPLDSASPVEEIAMLIEHLLPG